MVVTTFSLLREYSTSIVNRRLVSHNYEILCDTSLLFVKYLVYIPGNYAILGKNVTQTAQNGFEGR